MESESKYLDKTEACYEVEYALRQDIHFRKGEIIKLEHINAKHCREIERLNARISKILDPTSDVSHENLFEYLKALLVVLSEKEGNASINPDDIDVKYIEAASRYCYPVLFDKYAVLDQDDSVRHKIEMAEDILHKFDITEMYEYENLINRGEIDLKFIDTRVYLDCAKKMPSLEDMGGETKLKTELADRILHRLGIETMAKYEELVERGDIDLKLIDRRDHPLGGQVSSIWAETLIR